MNKALIVGGWSLVVMGCLWAGCAEPKSESQQALEKYLGRDVSGLSVQTLDGKPVMLKKSLDGRPLVLNVFATWCAPCLEELPALSRLGQQGAYKVIAIATDNDAPTVRRYLEHLPGHEGFDTWWDSLGNITNEALGARGLPSTYVLDAGGTVRLVAAGPRVWDSPEMAEEMARALR